MTKNICAKLATAVGNDENLHVFVPAELIPVLIDSLREELAPIADSLRTLVKYVSSDFPYSFSDVAGVVDDKGWEVPGFMVKVDEDAANIGFSMDESVAMNLLPMMAQALHGGTWMWLGMEQLGFVDMDSPDGKAAMRDLADPDPAEVDIEVWGSI